MKQAKFFLQVGQAFFFSWDSPVFTPSTDGVLMRYIFSSADIILKET